VTSGSLTNYYLPDGLGNIRTLAGSSGNLTSDRYQYDAYGSLRAGSVTVTQNAYRYKGQQYDQATGLYNLRARYYNSTQGRFLSQDRAGYDFENPVELNRYGYVAGNPITRYDPSGRLLAETGLQSSEEEEPAQAGLSSEGQVVRNEDAGVLYQLGATLTYLQAKQSVQIKYAHDPEVLERCSSHAWDGGPSVTVAYTMVDPDVDRWFTHAPPILRPAIAAKGRTCGEFRLELALLALQVGGRYHEGGLGPDSHAERVLHEAYFYQIPQVWNKGEGSFWAIGVFNFPEGLCPGCFEFFTIERQALMYPLPMAIPSWVLVAYPYVPDL